MMIRIELKNGYTAKYASYEYTEYDVRQGFLVIIKDEQWVGMYALDSLLSLEVIPE